MKPLAIAIHGIHDTCIDIAHIILWFTAVTGVLSNFDLYVLHK